MQGFQSTGMPPPPSFTPEKSSGFSSPAVKKKSPATSPFFIKGQWSPQEDELLVSLVNEYGLKKWSHIARMLVGRIGKQCRERWHNHLRPDIKKETWTEEEEVRLIEAHAHLGNRWAEIAKRIPGRTENAIKNHWNATKRRQLSRKRRFRKLSSSNGTIEDLISPLEHYIRMKCMEQATVNNIDQTKAANCPISQQTPALCVPNSNDLVKAEQIDRVKSCFAPVHNDFDDLSFLLGTWPPFSSSSSSSSLPSVWEHQNMNFPLGIPAESPSLGLDQFKGGEMDLIELVTSSLSASNWQ